jgi:hypothetical protein
VLPAPRARGARPAQAHVSRDYVGGLALTPDGLYTLVAAADGVVSLLDVRKAGARLSYATCSAPLRCLQTDGRYAVVGLESGQARLAPPRMPGFRAEPRQHAIV